MLRKTIALVIAATLGMALTADRAEAWGGFRAGGFRVGGYGSFAHYRVGGFGGLYGGAYHVGVTGYSPYRGFYHYS